MAPVTIAGRCEKLNCEVQQLHRRCRRGSDFGDGERGSQARGLVCWWKIARRSATQEVLQMYCTHL